MLLSKFWTKHYKAFLKSLLGCLNLFNLRLFWMLLLLKGYKDENKNVAQTSTVKNLLI